VILVTNSSLQLSSEYEVPGSTTRFSPKLENPPH
jgi:hypothetical protein